VYNVEPKDGTVLNIFFGTIVLQQTLGAEGVQFDARRFQWLGGVTKTITGCAVRTDIGVDSIRDIIAGKQVILGTTGPGTTLRDTPAVLNATIGSHFRLVPGYPGIQEIVLAIEKNEVEGFCAGTDPLILAARPLLEKTPPALKMVVVMGGEPLPGPFLGGVPPAETLATTDEARQMLRAVNAPGRITNSFAVAPGVPANRVAALRKALADTLVDPQFRADAERGNLKVDPTSADEVTRIVEDLLSTPPQTLAKLKEILK